MDEALAASRFTRSVPCLVGVVHGLTPSSPPPAGDAVLLRPALGAP